MPHRLFALAAAFSFAVCSSVLADGPKDNQLDNVRRVPPPGVEVPEKDAAELRKGLDALAKELASLPGALKKQPALLELIPDVEIFHKAVRYALDYQEFHKTNEVASGKALLQQGMERAAQLKAGQAPWARATGLVVRGFRSRIDGSVQPYALVVPESAKAGLPLRLDIWFHGRGETLSEVNFLTQGQRSPGQFTPPNTLVLHVYNRYCNPARFAGETDVFEAFEHVQQYYPVDENRVLVRGFSMGGASTWGFATHHAWRWAAAQPGAGFSETADFLKVFQQEELKPHWWEQKLWRLYDATDHALNLFNVPTVVYSGEKDRQKQAADIMEKAAAAEGLRLTHIIGPDTEHKFEPGAKLEVERRIDAIAQQGREPVPQQVKFTTFTLRYNRMFWVVVEGLQEHWERARVDAEFHRGKNAFIVDTKGVTELSLVFEPGQYPLDLTKRAQVTLDGQNLTAPLAFTDRSFTARFIRDGRGWQPLPEQVTKKLGSYLAKRHGLQGPIDDAFMDSFLFVRPTGQPMNAQAGQWVQAELKHAITHWRQQFRGDVRLKDDVAVTPEDIAAHHLILWGDPQSNQLLKEMTSGLPVKWDPATVTMGGKGYPSATHAPVLIFPNPKNPSRYVVLNSSFTYREYDYLNNARQTPKLPDWAIVDLTTPPNSRWPGRIVEAGFFGEKWELKGR